MDPDLRGVVNLKIQIIIIQVSVSIENTQVYKNRHMIASNILYYFRSSL